ncbi:hypothetical protein SAMN02745215_02900 [Desulfitobacterium chlororespirans DSM 11544]|uniref:Uncharacterized protein n=1 Tax=Desulfitobacterium chlororespirans DSM 11544 TaxID=1121395 RepID=A0A1M7U3Q7_9FIRM|nr:hypothetical protein SAMN02745215_02900 [Desulfitobacterium chlororespirans DSM 11544]
MPDQIKNGPQVLADLVSLIKKYCNVSISDPELIEKLCDGDLAVTNYAADALRYIVSVEGICDVQA